MSSINIGCFGSGTVSLTPDFKRNQGLFSKCWIQTIHKIITWLRLKGTWKIIHLKTIELYPPPHHGQGCQPLNQVAQDPIHPGQPWSWQLLSLMVLLSPFLSEWVWVSDNDNCRSLWMHRCIFNPMHSDARRRASWFWMWKVLSLILSLNPCGWGKKVWEETQQPTLKHSVEGQEAFELELRSDITFISRHH